MTFDFDVEEYSAVRASEEAWRLTAEFTREQAESLFEELFIRLTTKTEETKGDRE